MRTLADYLPTHGAVIASGVERDAHGRMVRLWTCAGCPVTVRTLDPAPATATAFIGRYVRHDPECPTASGGGDR